MNQASQIRAEDAIERIETMGFVDLWLCYNAVLERLIGCPGTETPEKLAAVLERDAAKIRGGSLSGGDS